MPLVVIATLVGLAACGGGGGGDGSAPPGGGSSRLDLACDADGWLTYDYFAINTADSIRAVVVQPDGKIIVGGYARLELGGLSDDDFAVKRFNADCTLDTTFVLQNGHFGGTSNDQIHALALQADGKIVAVGTTQWTGTATESNLNFALARYTSTGVLDTTFGSGGMVVTNVSACSAIACGMDEAYAVAIQPSVAGDKIVVAGYYTDVAAPGVWHFALARYTSTGALDATFGSSGVVKTSILDQDVAYSIAVQSDGKIVVAGETANLDGSIDQFALVRYTRDGALDATFSGDGKVTNSFGGPSGARAMVLQPGGKIVVAGTVGSFGNTVLARYTAAGALETGFAGGDDWALDTSFTARAVALQADGKIVLAGRTGGDFAVARFNADGTKDTGFGTVSTSLGSSDDRALAVAIQADGKIVAAGHSGGDFALARYLP
jgi:uncharacterized delta-60 repeat protein